MSDRSDFKARGGGGGGDAAGPLSAGGVAGTPAPAGASLAGFAQRPAGQKPKPVSRLVLAVAASIQPEPIRWLMPGRIALGKLTLIAGDPGLGKSMLSVSLASHVTTCHPRPGVLCAGAIGAVL